MENAKKPARCGLSLNQETELLQLDFLVIHVLASLGIKFLDQQLFRCGFFVFVSRVEVTGAGCRFQLDFFASAFACHDGSLMNYA